MDREDVEYYSAVKKNEIMPFAAMLLDLEIIMLSEVRQISLMDIKYDTQLSMKQKRTHRHREQIYVCHEGVGEGWIGNL